MGSISVKTGFPHISHRRTLCRPVSVRRFQLLFLVFFWFVMLPASLHNILFEIFKMERAVSPQWWKLVLFLKSGLFVLSFFFPCLLVLLLGNHQLNAEVAGWDFVFLSLVTSTNVFVTKHNKPSVDQRFLGPFIWKAIYLPLSVKLRQFNTNHFINPTRGNWLWAGCHFSQSC